MSSCSILFRRGPRRSGLEAAPCEEAEDRFCGFPGSDPKMRASGLHSRRCKGTFALTGPTVQAHSASATVGAEGQSGAIFAPSANVSGQNQPNGFSVGVVSAIVVESAQSWSGDTRKELCCRIPFRSLPEANFEAATVCSCSKMMPQPVNGDRPACPGPSLQISKHLRS